MKTVIVPFDVVPRGIKCRICNRIARTGQVVLWESVPDVMHIVFHRVCIEKHLSFEPEDLDGSIEEEYNEMVQMFEKGNPFKCQ